MSETFYTNDHNEVLFLLVKDADKVECIFSTNKLYFDELIALRDILNKELPEPEDDN